LTDTWGNGEKTVVVQKKQKPKGKKPLLKNTCLDCSSPIHRRATRCKSCAGKKTQKTKIDWPPTEVLLEKLKTSNFLALSRELGVTGNAIRKRIKNHPVEK